MDSNNKQLNPHEIKNLKSLLAKAQADAALLGEEAAQANRKKSQADAKIKDLSERLARCAESTGPIISEHAMLRWMERVEMHDLKALVDRILTPEAKAAINFAKNGKYVVADKKVVLIFKNSTVVTVEPL